VGTQSTMDVRLIWIGLLGSNVLIVSLIVFASSTVLMTKANGDDWYIAEFSLAAHSNVIHRQRQRRTLAPIFNERISNSVWNESFRQARMMLEYLVKNPGGQTLEGMHNVAINVIGSYYPVMPSYVWVYLINY
jgi:hypothetical protein